MAGSNHPELSSPDISVFLLAENRLLRETLSHLLQKRADIIVAGVSRITETAAKEVAASQCAILLTDCATSDGDPKLVCEIFQQIPGIKVILFGMDEDSATFVKFAYLGVGGYLLKNASAAEIIAAVRGVAKGDAACPPKLCMNLIQHLALQSQAHPRTVKREDGAKRLLTHRQLQLLGLVAKGATNKEIAAALNLSEFTVKNHIRRIMKQVDADTRHEAVDMIRASGFLPGV